MELERKNVKFKSIISTCDNGICDACHGGGKVIKLDLPETKYFNGTGLKTKRHPYWLCHSCRDKLVKALEWEVAENV